MAATRPPTSSGVPPPIGRLLGTPGPGEALQPDVAQPIAARLGVDVSRVRVHRSRDAQAAAAAIGARAFAYGRDVFLGPGQSPTDLRLMAHEVAHVVQQQGGQMLQRSAAGGNDRYEREAHRAAAAVVASEQFTVQERTRPRVQRIDFGRALNFFADKANLIPGFRMFTIILGINPINMSRVERSAANIMRALIEFIPGGGLITQALDNYGIFDRVGNWVEQQIRTLGMTGSAIRQAINEFLDSLNLGDVFDLGGVWERAKRIFTDPIRRIIDFAVGTVSGIVKFIKDAILRPLAALAEGTRGYDLLKAVLGQDPITGEAVPRNADTLIGGFMKLIGKEEVWNNLKRARAVERAWAWFQGALSGLLGFVRQIPGLFLSALQQLELIDIVLVPRAFAKIGRVFGGFAAQFFSWAGQQVMSLLQIIFEVVAPSVMPYIRKAMGAFRQIIQNPIGFVGNLVRAGIQGFRQFAGNFLNHLRRSLIEWLTGTLSGAGIYIPRAFELREIIKFVLSVLGLTWQNIRGKLVRLIPEPAVRALETGFDIVVTLVREGPAAAWDKIRESISNLRDMVMEQIMSFVQSRIVQAAITRLVTSLNPAGAFIQAIIAIYNTVMFFVERLRQIAQVVAAFIDSISAIASGAIGAAANRVEQTMGGLLTLVISFLARLVGLGRVSDAVTNIVNRIRAPIDRALDRVVQWIVTMARRVGRALVSGARAIVERVREWWRVRRTFAAADRTSHALYFQGAGAGAVLTVATTAAPVNAFLRSISGAASSSADPTVRTAYQGAVRLAGNIDTIRDRVERGPNPRQPRDIDELNQKMLDLATLLGPLIPLAYPAPGAAAAGGNVPVAVGELIKVTSSNLVAVVSAISDRLVNYKFIRPGVRHVTAEGRAVAAFIAQFGSEYTKYVEDPRTLYMGPTPDKTSPVATRIKQRMAAEGRYRPDNGGEIAYFRNMQAMPLPAGQPPRWVSVANCDMGHVIDAVTWWNSNGRLTGAQSQQVLTFMNDSDNYELEPSAENRLRGARIGARYLPPVI